MTLEERNGLVGRWDGMVFRVYVKERLWRFRHSAPKDDLLQAGRVGLIRAIEQFNSYQPKCSFTTAIYNRIFWAMCHELKDRGLIRVPAGDVKTPALRARKKAARRVECVGVLPDVVDDRQADDGGAAELDRRALVEELLRQVPGRKREVIEMRYGLRGGAGLTLDEVGEVMRLSRERVRQLQMSGEHKIEDFVKFRRYELKWI